MECWLLSPHWRVRFIPTHTLHISPIIYGCHTLACSNCRDCFLPGRSTRLQIFFHKKNRLHHKVVDNVYNRNQLCFVLFAQCHVFVMLFFLEWCVWRHWWVHSVSRSSSAHFYKLHQSSGRRSSRPGVWIRFIPHLQEHAKVLPFISLTLVLSTNVRIQEVKAY